MGWRQPANGAHSQIWMSWPVNRWTCPGRRRPDLPPNADCRRKGNWRRRNCWGKIRSDICYIQGWG
jgi:hypothetical protein